MKIFTKGELNAPLRVNFYYGERDDQQLWANNDLNTIIQHLHAEKVRITHYHQWKNFIKFSLFNKMHQIDQIFVIK